MRHKATSVCGLKLQVLLPYATDAAAEDYRSVSVALSLSVSLYTHTYKHAHNVLKEAHSYAGSGHISAGLVCQAIHADELACFSVCGSLKRHTHMRVLKEAHSYAGL